MAEPQEKILILDFGSQYAQLIARRVRELGVFSKIVPHDIHPEQIARENPRGIILSGGPASVWAEGAPQPHPKIFETGVPTLGICYGMQLMGRALGAEVSRASQREFGKATLTVDEADGLFAGLPGSITSWMSHGDYLLRPPAGFRTIAHTESTPVAAMAHSGRRQFGVQFHPEVTHTPQGPQILRNFLFSVCGCRGEWSGERFVEETLRAVREQVGDDEVVLGLSGGVDSSVTAVLLHRAIGSRLIPIFIDTGLLRKGEAREVEELFGRRMGLPLRVVDASDRFLKALAGIEDPEEKRRRIGRVFVECFEAEAKKHPRARFLAQGTLYPDCIESRSPQGGPSATIKTHHNVGGLPERMNLKLVEPLNLLFKDEVRRIGRVLGIPEEVLGRHPFPGPGLAVRILGAVTPERLKILREVEARFIEELRRAGWYDKVWQAFAVLLPVRSVGVMGDERTYEQVAALRAVQSCDGMTADWSRLPADLLEAAANRIVNEVRGVNRVVYDVTSKPPGTIEWE